MRHRPPPAAEEPAGLDVDFCGRAAIRRQEDPMNPSTRALCLAATTAVVLAGCASLPAESTTSAAADRAASEALRPAQAPTLGQPAWANTVQDQGFLY